MSVTEKRIANDRLQSMISEQSQGDPRITLLNAYKLKHDFIQQEKNIKKTQKEHCIIRTLDPIIIQPQKKFNHCPGARISPDCNHSILVSLLNT